jgi:hypothetical protein
MVLHKLWSFEKGQCNHDQCYFHKKKKNDISVIVQFRLDESSSPKPSHPFRLLIIVCVLAHVNHYLNLQ